MTSYLQSLMRRLRS